MNKVNLYKTKRIDNGEWVEGNLILLEESEQAPRAFIIPIKQSGVYIRPVCETEKEDLVFSTWYSVNPDTICQCIGKIDKNGQEIWENDLVKDLFGNILVVFRNSAQSAYYVTLFKQSNEEKQSGRFRIGAFRRPDLERIGSVFDRQEVL